MNICPCCKTSHDSTACSLSLDARRNLCHPWWSATEISAIEDLAKRLNLSPVEAMRDALYQTVSKRESRVHELIKAGVEIIEAARRSLPRPHPTIERNAKLFTAENA